MSKFVCTALALIGAGAAAQADPSTDAWLGLDHEISNLTTSLTAQGGGVDVGALIRSSYANVEDTLAGGSNDEAGWAFEDVDVWLEGEVGDYDWRVSVDFDGGGNALSPSAMSAGGSPLGNLGGGADLEDAYATWQANDYFALTWGQFKAPVTQSTSIDPERMAFVDRSAIGQTFDGWQLGAMLSGGQDGFGWFLAVQNGADNVGDEYRLSGRAEFSIGGHESGALRNGCSDNSSDELAGTAGIFFVQDDGLVGVSDNTIIGLDAAGTMGPFSAHAEVADFDTGIGDNSPFAFAFGYLINDEWHGAIRYEDLDDALTDTNIITLALSWLQGGAAAWTFEVGSVDANAGSPDGTFFRLNLSVGATRS